MIPADAAAAIATACRIDQLDLDALGDRRPNATGVPVIGLVEQLRAARGRRRRRVRPSRGDEPGHPRYRGDGRRRPRRGRSTADRLDEAARRSSTRFPPLHGTAPMIGRTLGQFALPTTFANVTGRWRRGLVEATGALRTLAADAPGAARRAGRRRVVVRAARPPRSPPESPSGSGSPSPTVRGRRVRTPIARIAGAWGVVGTVVGDVATQLVALMASDVGELAERADGCRRLLVDGPQAQPGRGDLAPAPRPCRCPGSSPRCCTPPAGTTSNGPPARGTPSGRRSTPCCGPAARPPTGWPRACDASSSTPTGWPPT